jgi:hypothetical protein
MRISRLGACVVGIFIGLLGGLVLIMFLMMLSLLVIDD